MGNKVKEPKEFLTPEGLLNKKAILDGMPLSLKMIGGGIIDWANTADMDHSGKADLIENMPKILAFIRFASAIQPLLVAVLPYLDLQVAIKWFSELPFVKDKNEVVKVATAVQEQAKEQGLTA